jgi:cobalamin biosynthesis Mg chelatase CobN
VNVLCRLKLSNVRTTSLLDSMIPHHQNAVNMAKTLLKLGGLSCDDLLNEEQTDCIMVNMMRDTINSQNQQIQAMRNVLEALNLPYADDCVVTVTSETTDTDASDDTGAAADEADGEQIDPDDYGTDTSASAITGSTSSGPAPPSSSSSSALLWITAILSVLCLSLGGWIVEAAVPP